MKHEDQHTRQAIDGTEYSHRTTTIQEHNQLLEVFIVLIVCLFQIGFGVLFLRGAIIFASSCQPTEVSR